MRDYTYKQDEHKQIRSQQSYGNMIDVSESSVRADKSRRPSTLYKTEVRNESFNRLECTYFHTAKDTQETFGSNDVSHLPVE